MHFLQAGSNTRPSTTPPATSILHGSAPNSPKSDIGCTQLCTAILPDTDDTVNNSGLLRFANLEASHRVVLCPMKMPVSKYPCTCVGKCWQKFGHSRFLLKRMSTQSTVFGERHLTQTGTDLSARMLPEANGTGGLCGICGRRPDLEQSESIYHRQ